MHRSDGWAAELEEQRRGARRLRWALFAVLVLAVALGLFA